MWRGSAVPFDTAWSTFIHWVQTVADDHSPRPQRDKVIADKPAAAVDGCWSSSTNFIAEPQTFGTSGSTCNTLFPSYAFPRYVAGDPVSADRLKCQLMPVQRGDYASLSDAQFAQLQSIFPTGVCNFAKLGVGQTSVVQWPSFGPAPENLVFDITKS